MKCVELDAIRARNEERCKVSAAGIADVDVLLAEIGRLRRLAEISRVRRLVEIGRFRRLISRLNPCPSCHTVNPTHTHEVVADSIDVADDGTTAEGT